MKKIIVIMLFIGAPFLYGIIGGIMLNGGFIPAPNYKKMERYFSDNIKELSFVAESLSKLEYEYIVLRETEGSSIMYATNTEFMPNTNIEIGKIGGNISISDVSLVKNIEKLYEKGFSCVEKKGDKYIIFVRWSSLNSGRGIVFSINGDEPDVDNIIDLKSLPIENWYYYEDNYELAKKKD